MFKFIKKEEGFTLVEILVAVVIIAFVLLAGVKAMGAAFEAQSSATMRATSNSLAQNRLNTIKDNSYINTVVLKTPTDVIPQSYKGESIFIKNINTDWSPELDKQGIQYKRVDTINNVNYNTTVYVTGVNNASNDFNSEGIQLAPTNINDVNVTNPIIKRVTVIVDWNNGREDLSTEIAWVRTPTPAECIPPRLLIDGGATQEQYDNQMSIRECEGER